MSFTPGKCAVCGAHPTVKSHIIPRGLAHDLRASSKHLVSGSIFKPGLSHLQSGRWDGNILCAGHEAALTAYDDYGIRFVRSFRAAPFAQGDVATKIPNPSPKSLQSFFLAMIWRKDLSNLVMGGTRTLGPYSDKIQDALFNGTPIVSPIILLRSPTAVGGQRIPIFVEPHRTKLAQWNAWKCELGWLGAAVVLDRRPLMLEQPNLDASLCETAEVINSEPIEIHKMESLAPLFANMRRRAPPFRA